MTTIASTITTPPPITNSIAYPYYHSADTATLVLDSESLSLVVLPKGWELESGHHLNSILLIQLRTSRGGVLAITYLQAEEYGWGRTESEAIMDLMSSLAEYTESLEARQEQLGRSTLADLEKLRQLFS